MSTTHDVDVHVWHGFAAVWSVVNDEAKTAFVDFELAGDVACFQEKVAQKFLVFFMGGCHTGDHFFGNEEEVGWRFGRNVVEAEAKIVFVNDFGRDLAGDDFFEESHAG